MNSEKLTGKISQRTYPQPELICNGEPEKEVRAVPRGVREIEPYIGTE
jgi:hypothetical protein